MHNNNYIFKAVAFCLLVVCNNRANSQDTALTAPRHEYAVGIYTSGLLNSFSVHIPACGFLSEGESLGYSYGGVFEVVTNDPIIYGVSFGLYKTNFELTTEIFSSSTASLQSKSTAHIVNQHDELAFYAGYRIFEDIIMKAGLNLAFHSNSTLGFTNYILGIVDTKIHPPVNTEYKNYSHLCFSYFVDLCYDVHLNKSNSLMLDFDFRYKMPINALEEDLNLKITSCEGLITLKYLF